MPFHCRPRNAFSSLLRTVSSTYKWAWKHLQLMLRSAEINTLSMANNIYRDFVCRANGGIYRLSGGTPW